MCGSAGIFYLWIFVTFCVILASWLAPRAQRLRERSRVDEKIESAAKRIQQAQAKQMESAGKRIQHAQVQLRLGTHDDGKAKDGGAASPKQKASVKGIAASLVLQQSLKARIARERRRRGIVARQADRELRSMGIDINDESGMMRSCLAQVLQVKQIVQMLHEGAEPDRLGAQVSVGGNAYSSPPPRAAPSIVQSPPPDSVRTCAAPSEQSGIVYAAQRAFLKRAEGEAAALSVDSMVETTTAVAAASDDSELGEIVRVI